MDKETFHELLDNPSEAQKPLADKTRAAMAALDQLRKQRAAAAEAMVELEVKIYRQEGAVTVLQQLLIETK